MASTERLTSASVVRQLQTEMRMQRRARKVVALVQQVLLGGQAVVPAGPGRRP